MEVTVRIEEYVFAGVVQRSLAVEGAAISGAASEQRAGGWAWYLRYADGEWAGEGRDATWEGVLRGIRQALVMETRYGRLSYLRRDTVP